MSGPKFDPHDPRLTAYVLGELDEDARGDVEALLETSPEARAVVNDLGDLATWLEEDLALEPGAGLSEDARTRIRTAASAPACEFAIDPVDRSGAIARDMPGPAAGGPVVLSALVAVVALCLLTLVLPTGKVRDPARPGADLAVSGDTLTSGGTVTGHEFAAVSNTIADRARIDARERDTSRPDEWLFGRNTDGARDFDGDGRVDGVHLAGGIGGGAPTGESRFETWLASGTMQWGAWYDESRLYYVPSQRSVVDTPPGTINRFHGSRWGGTSAGFVTSPERFQTSEAGNGGIPVAGARGFGGNGEGINLGTTVDSRVEYEVAVNEAQRGREVERLARANLALADLANRRQERVLELRLAQQDLGLRDKDGEPSDRLRALEERVAFEQNELVNVERRLKQVQLAQLDAPPTAVNFVPLERGFVSPVDVPVSNPTVAVQTDSYHWTRLNVDNGTVPPPDTVRVEDFVNSFTYTMPEPERDPVAVVLEAGPCPWNTNHRLVRVALKGREANPALRPPSNYTFLFDFKDTDHESRVPLVQHGLRVLNDGLNAKDRLAIVANGPESKVWLDANGDDRVRVRGVIDELKATTSTNAVPGIRAAYTNGKSGFVKAGVNSVVICTDRNGLLANDNGIEVDELVRRRADDGFSLNVVQFGRHVPPDGQLAELARAGNGRFAQVDGVDEVEEVFEEELLTRPIVAEDVELRVEFNPAQVTSYRLVGFDDPPVTGVGRPHLAGGEKQTLSAGQRFTALYEVEPKSEPPAPIQHEQAQLRYQKLATLENAPVSDELLALNLKYRPADATEAVEHADTLVDDGGNAVPSREFGWASAVAAYGLVLRDSAFKGTADLELVERLTKDARGPDPTGEQREFVELVQRTRAARAKVAGRPQPAPVRLSDEDARIKATVGGKYTALLRKIESPDDHQLHSTFDDFGWWEGNSYGDHERLPKAHWVYVYPHWYLWGERAADGSPRAETSPAVEERREE